jgi:hypothetical protein
MSAPACRRCGTSRWVAPGAESETLRPWSWFCLRCLARVKARDKQARPPRPSRQEQFPLPRPWRQAA